MVTLKPVTLDAFVLYLKGTEDFKDRLYNPTGGVKEDFLTIGYGHKCASKAEEKSYEGRAITEADATTMLRDDIARHMPGAQAAYDRFVQPLNKRKWAALSDTERFMLTDIALNGGLANFPKFMTAVADKDYDRASTEHVRYWLDTKGGKHQLSDRKEKFNKAFFVM